MNYKKFPIEFPTVFQEITFWIYNHEPVTARFYPEYESFDSFLKTHHPSENYFISKISDLQVEIDLPF